MKSPLSGWSHESGTPYSRASISALHSSISSGMTFSARASFSQVVKEGRCRPTSTSLMVAKDRSAIAANRLIVR